MCAIQRIKIIVQRERRRRPTGGSRVAACAIRRQAQNRVIGVGRRVEIGGVAGGAIGRRIFKTGGVAVQTFQPKVRSIQRKTRRIVVKNQVGIARWVTGKAGIAFINIAADALMLIVRFARFVTSRAGEFSVIPRVRVAVHASIPLALVLARINRKILRIVVESGRRPGSFRVASRTILRKLERHVVRVGRRVEIVGVAAETGARRIRVIPVVASCAIIGNRSVSAVQRVKIIVQRESSRRPIGQGRVAHRTIVRQVQRDVIWIHTALKIRRVATAADVRRGQIIPPNVASNAVIRHRQMRPGERVNCVVVKSRRRPNHLRVASFTFHRNLVGSVIRVVCGSKISRVTAVAGVRRVQIISPGVAGDAVIRHRQVRPGNHEK